jgi:hypothetical protein
VGALKLWEMFTHAVKRGEEQGEELCTPALQKQERLGGSNREDTWPYCCRPDGTYSDVAAFVNALCEGELSKCRKQEQEEEEERQFLLPAKGGGAAAMRMHPPPRHARRRRAGATGRCHCAHSGGSLVTAPAAQEEEAAEEETAQEEEEEEGTKIDVAAAW